MPSTRDDFHPKLPTKSPAIGHGNHGAAGRNIGIGRQSVVAPEARCEYLAVTPAYRRARGHIPPMVFLPVDARVADKRRRRISRYAIGPAVAVPEKRAGANASASVSDGNE